MNAEVLKFPVSVWLGDEVTFKRTLNERLNPLLKEDK